MIRNSSHTTPRNGRIDRHAHNSWRWFRAGLGFVMTAVSLASTPLHAQEEWTPPPHVRPERGIRSLVGEAARRSALIRELIEQLEGLDVTVYIRTRPFQSAGLDGRIALLLAGGSSRYLVIELACERSGVTQMATLGHELYHALEIAREPSVVSPGTLADLYSRIGRQTGADGALRTFETDAAAAAGSLARRQVIDGMRHEHGT